MQGQNASRKEKMRSFDNFGSGKIDKARYWEGIIYPENMPSNWKSTIDDTLQMPFCYCVHDKDNLMDTGERKIHVHILLAFNNTTTRKHALQVLNLLSLDGKICCPMVEACISIRKCYDYLIHNTESSQDKYQYPEDERIEGNGFDIGCYEQLSQADKQKYMWDIEDIIFKEGIDNYYMLCGAVRQRYGSEHYQVLIGHSGHYYRLLQGLYVMRKKEREEQERKSYENWKQG